MSDDLTKLRGEITALLDQIGGDGLLFLKKQATTIIYNNTVQEMNQNKALKGVEPTPDIKGTVEDRDEPIIQERLDGFNPKELYIDMGGEEKGFCNIVCGKVRVFFTIEELDILIFIAEKAAGKGDGALLLYRWLKKERGDFLVDNGIMSYPSPIIDSLASLLISE
jgi:hypothetical protein